MKSARRANLIIAVFTLVVIAVFGYAYNKSVSNAVSNVITDDRAVLTEYNNEIIALLQKTASVDEWQAIVDAYEDLYISIKDSDNEIIIRSAGRQWSALDVKTRTPFSYHKRAYMVLSSMRLMRDSTSQTQYLLRILSIEFLIGLSALCMLAFTIYSVLLRPYHKFYQIMEAYEQGETLEEQNFRGNIGRIYRRFLQLTRTLDRQQENQRQIIAAISHDVKTPLTSILGYAERLQKTDLPRERQQQYLTIIYEKATDIRALIDEFDEYLSYKIDKEPHAEPITTQELCRLLRDEFRDELNYAGIDLAIYNHAPDVMMELNHAKVKRVVGNLISNSAKHVPSPGGRIEIELNADRDRVIFIAADNGDGMDSEKLPFIFEPLYTTDTSRKVAGLGLSICKEIVESRGGTIEAFPSQKLGGLEIRITIPRKD